MKNQNHIIFCTIKPKVQTLKAKIHSMEQETHTYNVITLYGNVNINGVYII